MMETTTRATSFGPSPAGVPLYRVVAGMPAEDVLRSLADQLGMLHVREAA
jgi:hypothetical protein